ncbi:MAG TPA: hypothetical protein VK465_18625 [Fibrobacteria bacterium]|nr:hypothetical protein [Fibrobacteria bacterium]
MSHRFKVEDVEVSINAQHQYGWLTVPNLSLKKIQGPLPFLNLPANFPLRLHPTASMDLSAKMPLRAGSFFTR